MKEVCNDKVLAQLLQLLKDPYEDLCTFVGPHRTGTHILRVENFDYTDRTHPTDPALYSNPYLVPIEEDRYQYHPFIHNRLITRLIAKVCYHHHTLGFCQEFVEGRTRVDRLSFPLRSSGTPTNLL